MKKTDNLRSIVLLLLMLAAGSLLTACGANFQPAPGVAIHDLGGAFPQGGAKTPVPLRALNVTAQTLVNTTAMQYREAARPTQRAHFAVNRWAAPPAAMVEPALNRLLAVGGSGGCRMQIHIVEFIVEVDADGKSRSLVSADARLLTDGRLAPLQRSFDAAAPLPQTSPAQGAMAMRQAVQKLAHEISAWLGSDAAAFCKAS